MDGAEGHGEWECGCEYGGGGTGWAGLGVRTRLSDWSPVRISHWAVNLSASTQAVTHQHEWVGLGWGTGFWGSSPDPPGQASVLSQGVHLNSLKSYGESWALCLLCALYPFYLRLRTSSQKRPQSLHVLVKSGVRGHQVQKPACSIFASLHHSPRQMASPL